MEQKQLKDLKQGDFFKLTEGSSVVYVKGEYMKSSKKFEAYKFEDFNSRTYKKGNHLVWVGFTF